ncbi:chain-length determining protein [Fulvitalea axinellae]|uniref:Chain-length determining protein n=1 Tax=Fulvitalea axinellae TaxID=1182444 RepID=A0AAU9DHI0_9BACT|nr:chain-length determining protein [Fulvitalea axinellae]
MNNPNLPMMPPQQVDERQHIEEDEIDLVEVMKSVWEGRKYIIRSVIGCIVVGLIIALTSTKEYEAGATLMPESQEGMKLGGGLGGLASLAGINLGGMTGASGSISPELYPEVVKSVPFQLELSKLPLRFETLDAEMSALEYFPEYGGSVVKDYTIGLPGKILGAIRGEKEEVQLKAKGNLIRLTLEEKKVIKNMKERVSVNVDQKSGLITVSAKMPDPVAVAQIAQFTLDYLQRHITDYKIRKHKNNLDFVQERYDEQKKVFENAQKEVARFNDSHRNLVTNLARTELQNLESKYNIAFEVFKGLASQLEQSKIKLKEETPVFEIIEPVRVPLSRTSPKRGLIMVVSAFLGGILGIGFIFVKNLVNNIKEQWNASEDCESGDG